MVSVSLQSVHPALAARVTRLLAALEALGFPMMVTQARRTDAEQAALFAQGRPGGPAGPVVTHMDGVTRRSRHQLQDDGYGHAVDCAFLIAGKPSWEDRLPWKAYGECAKALGLVWGGDWIHFPDRPHVELPAPFTNDRELA